MGVMVSGQYLAQDPAPDTDKGGEFQRQKSTIRNWITADGSPGPTGIGGFSPDPDRYHLYTAWNCPWAHRVLLTLALKGIDIPVSYARPKRTDQGWVFDEHGEFADPLFRITSLHEVYSRVTPPFTGRVTVPLLWDKATQSPVSNESADIVRMLSSAFPGPDFSPAELVPQIDQWNELIYAKVNNGVYRAGFARTQSAYEAGVSDVFETLDLIEDHLASNTWLCADTFTEADIRLFPTLARFDVAYHYAFRCNLRRLQDYPNLWAYARRIYAMPGVAGTVRIDVYKAGYFSASEFRNPLGIVPLGPIVDWSIAHN